MTQFQIVFTLITIVYGLVITDLFSSFHKLIRGGKKVKWHWLPIVTAWYILHVILKNWWRLTLTSGSGHWENIITFILYAHLLLILFLLVSAVLPDAVPEEGIDLKSYYFQNHTYIWGLLSAVIIISVIMTLSRSSINGDSLNTSYFIFNGIILSLTVSLALNKKIILHSIAVLFFIAVLITEIVINN